MKKLDSGNSSGRRSIWLVLIFAVFWAGGSGTARKHGGAGRSKAVVIADPSYDHRTAIADIYGRIPLYFEANRGQTDRQVKFLARGHGFPLFLTPTEAVLRLHQTI